MIANSRLTFPSNRPPCRSTVRTVFLSRILLRCFNYSYETRLQVHVCGIRHNGIPLSNMAKNSVQRILGNSNNLSVVAIAIARARSMLLRKETR